MKYSIKKFCFHDFRSEKAIFVANDNPLTICIFCTSHLYTLPPRDRGIVGLLTF